ncbi:unnamed protein product, partial [Cyprideis torosa]
MVFVKEFFDLWSTMFGTGNKATTPDIISIDLILPIVEIVAPKLLWVFKVNVQFLTLHTKQVTAGSVPGSCYLQFILRETAMSYQQHVKAEIYSTKSHATSTSSAESTPVSQHGLIAYHTGPIIYPGIQQQALISAKPAAPHDIKGLNLSSTTLSAETRTPQYQLTTSVEQPNVLTLTQVNGLNLVATHAAASAGTKIMVDASVNTHISIPSGKEDSKKYKCSNCPKKFKDFSSLMQHHKQHTEEKPFECDFCGSQFKAKFFLQRHLLVHSGEKPFGCQFCPKRFTQGSHLNVHIRTHTNDRPFTCRVCHRSFKTKFVLERHMIVHSGEKNYACTFCGKRFGRPGHLQVHEKTHTKERPFPCVVCHRMFKTKFALDRHLQTHDRKKVSKASNSTTEPQTITADLPDESEHMPPNNNQQRTLLTSTSNAQQPQSHHTLTLSSNSAGIVKHKPFAFPSSTGQAMQAVGLTTAEVVQAANEGPQPQPQLQE